MPKSREYFDLIASLPALPHFESAERNPINRDRLEDRLRMLEPEDLAAIERLREFLAWERQPAARSDAEMVSMYEQFTRSTTNEAMREMASYRMIQRTVLAALRRRRKGRGAPDPGEPWGVGPAVVTIAKNWDDPDFKLAAVYPWIGPARAMLDSGESLALDRLLFDVEWTWLDSFAPRTPFSFEALVAYLLQWDILDQWLSYDERAAAERFEELVAEVTGEYYKLFD